LSRKKLDFGKFFCFYSSFFILTIIYNILTSSNTNPRAFESETEETHRLKRILASIKDNSEIVFGGKMLKSTAAILFCLMAIFMVTTSGVSGSKEMIKKVAEKILQSPNGEMGIML